MKKISQGYNDRNIFQITLECEICKTQYTFDSLTPQETEKILNRGCPICKEKSIKQTKIEYGVFILEFDIREERYPIFISSFQTKQEAIDFITKEITRYPNNVYTILEIYCNV